MSVPKVIALILAFAVLAGAADERSVAVDALFKQVVGDASSPGCAVVVIQNGRVVHSAAYGLANIENDVPLGPSSVFMIASTTKMFTGFLVELLRARGKLSLEDSVRKYIPELPAAFEPITLYHLLHHTSGIPQRSALVVLGLGPFALPAPQDEIQVLSRLRSLNH